MRYDAWQPLQRAVIQGEPSGITGAQMPSPMPYLIMAGQTVDGEQAHLYILARLNLNGQSLALANIYQDLGLRLDSAPFKARVEQAKAGGSGMKLKLAIPCVGSTHDLWLRYWLTAGDINPDTDVAIVVVPPAQMVANMETGTIHAFCVDDPFALALVNTKIGYAALTTGELWANHPEKAFAIRANWANAYPKATQALLMAVQEAQVWCDREVNWAEMVSILVDGGYLQGTQRDLLDRLQGNFALGDG